MLNLFVIFVVVLALLWLTKVAEERLGEGERFDQLITVPKERRNRYTVAGRRANKWCSW